MKKATFETFDCLKAVKRKDLLKFLEFVFFFFLKKELCSSVLFYFFVSLFSPEVENGNASLYLERKKKRRCTVVENLKVFFLYQISLSRKLFFMVFENSALFPCYVASSSNPCLEVPTIMEHMHPMLLSENQSKSASKS